MCFDPFLLGAEMVECNVVIPAASYDVILNIDDVLKLITSGNFG